MIYRLWLHANKRAAIVFGNAAVLFASPICCCGIAAAQTLPSPTIPAFAQKSVKLSPDEAKSFRQTLRRAAEAGNVTIIVDGTPRHDALPAQTAAALTGAKNLQAVFEVLEKYCDYQIVSEENAASQNLGGTTTRNQNFVLVQKMYQNGVEVPCITPEECDLALHDAIRILSPYDSRIGRLQSLAKSVMQSLTPEQAQALRSGGQPLPIAALGAGGKAALWKLSLDCYTGSALEEARSAANKLDSFSTAIISRKNENSQSVLDYAYTLQSGKPWHYPFAYLTVSDGTGGTIQNNMLPVMKQITVKESPSEDTSFTTLQRLAQYCSKQSGTAGAFVVDEALQEKPIMLFGVMDKQPPRSVFQAVADLYGLRVRAEEGGFLRMTRPRVRTPRNISEVGECVSEVIPAPLRRAVLRGAEPDMKPPADRAEFKAWEEQNSGAWERHDQPTIRLEAAALRCVKESWQPRLEAKPAVLTVAAKSLSFSERSVVANLLMMRFLQAFSPRLMEPAPTFITNFDQMYLTLATFEQRGKPMYEMNIAQKKGEDNFDKLIGMGGPIATIGGKK